MERLLLRFCTYSPRMTMQRAPSLYYFCEDVMASDRFASCRTCRNSQLKPRGLDLVETVFDEFAKRTRHEQCSSQMRQLAMDNNDFTFCKILSQADNDHVELPKMITDVNKVSLEDNVSDEMDLKSNDSFLDICSSANLPKKYGAHSGFPLFGSTDMPQKDFKSNESLMLEAAGNDREPLHGSQGQKPAHRKPAVRAKVPFEKGYSQMDWLKLTQTHPDLSGLKGQTNRRLITMDEVKKHKSEGSMWTVLKGRVYNISPYMKFHPGGVDMLMKATGKDCTSLFTKYHAWVNAEFLLEKCLVGVLDNDP